MFSAFLLASAYAIPAINKHDVPIVARRNVELPFYHPEAIVEVKTVTGRSGAVPQDLNAAALNVHLLCSADTPWFAFF